MTSLFPVGQFETEIHFNISHFQNFHNATIYPKPVSVIQMKLLLPWLLLLVLGKCTSQCINDQYGNLTWPATQSGHSVSLQCDSSGDLDSSVRRYCEGREWVTEHDPCKEELRGARSELSLQVCSLDLR